MPVTKEGEAMRPKAQGPLIPSPAPEIVNQEHIDVPNGTGYRLINLAAMLALDFAALEGKEKRV